MSKAVSFTSLFIIFILSSPSFIYAEGDLPPPCSAPFTCTNATNTNATNITAVTNQTSCLEACISCIGGPWRCSDAVRQTHTDKKSENETTTVLFKCQCAQMNPTCDESEWREVCVDPGFSAAGLARIYTETALIVGLATLYLLL
jgi:hypothetical protein